uniref:Secreted protein n=1 Tax=Anguilla anguilla TaxID=7936 RepID=A0A0E9RN07_ANGAN
MPVLLLLFFPFSYCECLRAHVYCPTLSVFVRRSPGLTAVSEGIDRICAVIPNSCHPRVSTSHW